MVQVSVAGLRERGIGEERIMPVFGLDYGGGDIFTGGDQCVDDLFERQEKNANRWRMT